MKTYETRGVCPRSLDYEIKNGRVYNVKFLGGCNGNLKAISKLIEGKEIKEVINLLKGIDCNGRGTSCADQLAKALDIEVN